MDTKRHESFHRVSSLPTPSPLCTTCAPPPSEVRLVADLTDGDVFSLDGGQTWHTCAVVLWGTVSVYKTSRRDDEAPCVRVEAPRHKRVLIKT